MKDKLSIGEFAKQRNITTETLRHYDRIGLLKPVKVDPDTGYRYYSILQYEKLGTIMELRQLNMSIDEIKRYFDNRNLNQSVELLREKHGELKEKILQLQQLEESIGEKIEYLEHISKVSDLKEMDIREISEREIITFNRCAENEIDLSYACLELENGLEEISPILGSSRIGAIVNYRDASLDESVESMVLFFFVKGSEGIDEGLIKKIPRFIIDFIKTKNMHYMPMHVFYLEV